MKEVEVSIAGFEIPVISLNTLIIGSGAAGLNCAVHLARQGQNDVTILTDDIEAGTSRNAGSDKQTYYKLSISGDTADSPMELARTLFSGGSMHGDIALVEAALSAQEFFHLVSLGVPFPHDRFGTYVGYRTDNDPRQRGTSAGPLTSRHMHESLLREVRSLGIEIRSGMEAVSLFRVGSSVAGALCIDNEKIWQDNMGMTLFNSENLVVATGGPGDLYRTSVYPESQRGSTGLAIEIGAICANLTEWQYGIASTKFRWNVSGTYQQSIPTYESRNENGESFEFLSEFFPNTARIADCIFAKGYEWPFDVKKVAGHGSSLIDLLVYRETVDLGRRVFLDFRRNPSGFELDELGQEAHEYLERSDALLERPIDRLEKMNHPAIELYADHGIDLYEEPLEVAVCAQHNNGGLVGNIWWESNVKHLFPIGEVNGSHGVYRPGGAALNSGQVGGLRAAEFICAKYPGNPRSTGEFLKRISDDLEKKIELISDLVGRSTPESGDKETIRDEIQDRMTKYGAHIRSRDGVDMAIAEARRLCDHLPRTLTISSREELPGALRLIHLAKTHLLYLEAMHEHIDRGGGSRGSSLILDPDGVRPCPDLGEKWAYRAFDGKFFDRILESCFEDGKIVHNWRNARPIPVEEGWFEKIWAEYRKGKFLVV